VIFRPGKHLYSSIFYKSLLFSTYERRTDSFRTVNKADGPLNIDAVDPEGGYVRLDNKGDEDLALGGYKIVVKDGEREVTYKFGPKLVLKPGKQVSVSYSVVKICGYDVESL
jgi:lamin B